MASMMWTSKGDLITFLISTYSSKSLHKWNSYFIAQSCLVKQQSSYQEHGTLEEQKQKKNPKTYNKDFVSIQKWKANMWKLSQVSR